MIQISSRRSFLFLLCLTPTSLPRATSAECQGTVELQKVGDFATPVFVSAPPLDFDRIFVVEKSGRIRIVKNGVTQPQPFLDIDSLVIDSGERGLLSMAFHPDYANNRFVYVFYTDPHTVIARYQVSDNPDIADASSATIIFRTTETTNVFHRGGQLQFGPLDGYLYAGLGDGGVSERSQDPKSVLGKLLRLDVNNPPRYIPAENPFVGAADPDDLARDEIWAMGLRNPWRFSFDSITGGLYVADVGVSNWEEVNYQSGRSRGGRNYGWPFYEGFQLLRPGTGALPRDPLVFPILAHRHPMSDAIIGGYVYRGTAIPELIGTYIYSDLEGFVQSFVWTGDKATAFRDLTVQLLDEGQCEIPTLSFGVDAAGELYLCSWDAVHKLVPRNRKTEKLNRGQEDSGDPPANDCNDNCVLDKWEIPSLLICGFTWNDCNWNRTPDDCEISQDQSLDCNSNGLVDECELFYQGDCDQNGIPDDCELRMGLASDCDGDGLLDPCEDDCNFNDVSDDCEMLAGEINDCNENSVPDSCESRVTGDFDLDAGFNFGDIAGLQRCFRGSEPVVDPCCHLFTVGQSESILDLNQWTVLHELLAPPFR